MQQWECHARWFRFIALAVLAIIIPASAAAQERCQDGEIVLNSATSSVRDLGSCIWYLEDPEHAVDFNDILSGDTAPFTRTKAVCRTLATRNRHTGPDLMSR